MFNYIFISPLYILLLYLLVFQTASAFDYRAYGYIQPENTFFLNGDGKHNQSKNNLSVYTQGTFISYIQDDNAKITVNGIGRYDENDKERTYYDFQKLKYEYYYDDFIFKIGNELVFWGVNESFSIVDIINQSNLAEDISGTKKLGQPMASISYNKDYGTFDIYVMPYFRERPFSGKKGRPRLTFEVDKNSITYESSSKKNKIDFALRYSTVLDDFDIGISHFYGNNRTPKLSPNLATLKFDSHYSILSQTGLDIQATKGPWLYKLETISAKDGSERHLSTAGGIEYTYYGIRNTPSDLGVIVEYAFDDRNDNPFNNEGIIGLRWSVNDIKSSSLLAGYLFDMRGNSNRFQVEFEQRVTDDLKLFLDLSLNGSIDDADFTYQFKEDSSVTLKLAKYF